MDQLERVLMLRRAHITDPDHTVALVACLLINKDLGTCGILDLLEFCATRAHEHTHESLLNRKGIIGLSHKEAFASSRRHHRLLLHCLHRTAAMATRPFCPLLVGAGAAAATAVHVPGKLNVAALRTNPITLHPSVVAIVATIHASHSSLHARLPSRHSRKLRPVLIDPSHDCAVSSISSIANDSHGCKFLLAQTLLDHDAYLELLGKQLDSLLPLAENHTNVSWLHSHFLNNLVTGHGYLWPKGARERLVYPLLDQLLGQLHCLRFANQAEEINGIALFGDLFGAVAVECYVSTTLLLKLPHCLSRLAKNVPHQLVVQLELGGNVPLWHVDAALDRGKPHTNEIKGGLGCLWRTIDSTD
mmetsp:Transcript_41833/g.75957  ORF Transcript_41833/g.75957 Transcript_41833/m.75957 type:complete len:360 (-) Transcript_41833:1142-2221(-)